VTDDLRISITGDRGLFFGVITIKESKIYLLALSNLFSVGFGNRRLILIIFNQKGSFFLIVLCFIAILQVLLLVAGLFYVGRLFKSGIFFLIILNSYVGVVHFYFLCSGTGFRCCFRVILDNFCSGGRFYFDLRDCLSSRTLIMIIFPISTGCPQGRKLIYLVILCHYPLIRLSDRGI
jgi:hypothetical protein